MYGAVYCYWSIFSKTQSQNAMYKLSIGHQSKWVGIFASLADKAGKTKQNKTLAWITSQYDLLTYVANDYENWVKRSRLKNDLSPKFEVT